MAISYPRSFPSAIKITSSRIGLNFNTAFNQSDLGRQITVINNNNGTTDRWEGVFTLAALNGQNMAEFEAWLISLKGQEKTFKAYDPDRRTPYGVADTGTSTPLIKGASQTGKSITTDGWKTSTTGLLAVGDYFQVETQFYIVTEIVTSNGTGDATINFEPAIRTAPADNAAIIFESPVMVARMGVNIHLKESNKNRIGTFSFSFMEAL